MEERKERRAQAPRLRLSAEKRDRFLEVLGQTGNRRYAAEAIGVEPRLMDQRRRFDKVLDREWIAALEQVHRRLSGADGPLDCIGGAEPMVIRRGPGGRLRIVAAGPRRWSRKVEDRFFALLAASGNIAASARAVGFSQSCIAQRRRKWPDFARRLEEALDDAEIMLEFRFAQACGWAAPQADAESGDAAPAASDEGRAERFDPDLAMRFLKWREDKRRGGGARRGRAPIRVEPTIEEVRDEIMRRLEAIRRHRERYGGGESEGDATVGDRPGEAPGPGDEPGGDQPAGRPVA